jgi:prephenate dehydrogenase
MSKIRVTLVGCGMLGTALGLAIKAAFKEAEVVGHDKDQNAARRAEKLKAVDRTNWNLPSACESAQLIILAIPEDGVVATLKAIAPDIAPGAIVTDTATLKAPLLARAADLVPAHAAFISSDIVFAPHRAPAAGDFDHLSAEALKGAIWTLTPRSGTESRDIDAMAGLASALGAVPMFIDAVEHDGLRLSVDVLPSLLGSAYLLAVTGDGAWRERKWLAGGAFQAAVNSLQSDHDAELSSALLSQPEAANHWINQTMLRLMAMRDAVRDHDAAAIQRMLADARGQYELWLSDWRKGRQEGGPQAPIERPTLLGALLGTRLATRLKEPPSRPGAPPSKNGQS